MIERGESGARRGLRHVVPVHEGGEGERGKGLKELMEKAAGDEPVFVPRAPTSGMRWPVLTELVLLCTSIV
jgi:hypothetical protein